MCSASADSGLCADNELCFVERAHSDNPRQLQGTSLAPSPQIQSNWQFKGTSCSVCCIIALIGTSLLPYHNNIEFTAFMAGGVEEQVLRSSMDRRNSDAGNTAEPGAQHGDGLEGEEAEGPKPAQAGEAVTGVCLPARMAAGHRACTSTQGTPQEGSGCARNAACMVPILLQGDHMFKVWNLLLSF